MNQQEWLEWRRQGIGSSDAPVIMGVSPWKKISDLIDEKVYGKEQEKNDHMKRGNNLESTALQMFSEKTGLLLSSQERMTHPNHDWMRATLDGVNFEKGIFVEAKCPAKQHEKIPDHYYPQLQHQFEVTGFEKGYFISYSENNLKIFEIERDEKYIAQLVKKEKEFWDALCSLDFSKYITHEDKSKDENWGEYAKLYLEADRAEKKAKEAKDFARSQLILFSEDKNASGAGIKLTKSLVKGAIDYGLVDQLKSIDLEKYRKPSFTKYTIMPYSN